MVPKVPFGRYLYIFPGKFLADPVKPGVGDHLHGQLALFEFYLLFEESIDPKGVAPGIGDGHKIGRLGLGARQAAQPFQAAANLGGQRLLAGHMEEEI